MIIFDDINVVLLGHVHEEVKEGESETEQVFSMQRDGAQQDKMF